MKIWLSKNSEISVHEQLVTQITLGIVSGDLAIGDKLPSTREIARRFAIHSNTVSAVYRKLSIDGWLEFKKGSGFYVCENRADDFDNKVRLDKSVAEFIKTLQDTGFSNEEIAKSFRKNLKTQTIQKLVLIESDEALREILAEEIRAKLKTEIVGIGFEEFKNHFHKSKAFFVALFDEKSKIESFLAAGQASHFLKVHSVPAAMTGEKRPSENDLIAVVSGWEKFLLLSKTFLIAAKVAPECLILKDTKQKNWRKGLENVSMIICDSLTATKLKPHENLRVFPIISEQSLNEVKEKYFGKTA
ncbi:MAG TPA: GntR family transcriptional regulator [Pyrinomonadaceae bacterium]|nr:GntR family transcriptional regulator [Pyrinomonadaceae bacterium]